MILEREKFFERTQKKKEREYEEKMDFYESKAAYMNEIYYARQKRIRDRLGRVRVRGRRASDGMIGVIGHVEELRERIEKQVEKKKLIKEENPFDNPFTKERMEYSFLWDRFQLFNADNADEQVVIDPTDNRINLQEQIQKYIQKQKVEKKKGGEDFFSSDSEIERSVTQNKTATHSHTKTFTSSSTQKKL